MFSALKNDQVLHISPDDSAHPNDDWRCIFKDIMMRTVKHQKRLHRDDVLSLPLEAFKALLDNALSNLVSCHS